MSQVDHAQRLIFRALSTPDLKCRHLVVKGDSGQDSLYRDVENLSASMCSCDRLVLCAIVPPEIEEAHSAGLGQITLPPVGAAARALIHFSRQGLHPRRYPHNYSLALLVLLESLKNLKLFRPT